MGRVHEEDIERVRNWAKPVSVKWVLDYVDVRFSFARRRQESL